MTEARLKALGIVSGNDLKQVSLEQLQELFGKRGTLLSQFVRGEDTRQVQPERERKSVDKETTFADDMTNFDDMLRVLEGLSGSTTPCRTGFGGQNCHVEAPLA